MLDALTVKYQPSPTGLLFHNSNADIRIVLGNVGSGKSTMMIIELLKMAMLQRPDKNSEIVSAVYSRLGRYPAPVDAIDEDNPITRVSLIMDTNPPEDDSWVAQIENTTPKGWAFFRQPPAIIKDRGSDIGYSLNPKGENFKYIGVGAKRYYLDRIPTLTPEQVKVLFEGQYGVTSSGKAVYKRQWDHDYHISKAGCWTSNA